MVVARELEAIENGIRSFANTELLAEGNLIWKFPSVTVKPTVARLTGADESVSLSKEPVVPFLVISRVSDMEVTAEKVQAPVIV